MLLSEQIANICCGLLADREEMIDKALELEHLIEVYEFQLLQLLDDT